MKQNNIKATAGARTSRKRVGRGGKHRVYCGRGMNGQNSRSGGGVRVGFEGGQTPLLQRMPKLKGFKNCSKTEYYGLNVSILENRFEDGDSVDVKALMAKGILKKEMPIKLLGTGEIKKKLNVTVHLASKSGAEKIEKAGGKITLLGVVSTKKSKREASTEEKKES